MPHRAHPYGATKPHTLQNLRGALDVDGPAAAVRYVGTSLGARSMKLCSRSALNVRAAAARLFSTTPRVARLPAFFFPLTITASPSLAFSFTVNSSSSDSCASPAVPGTKATSDSNEFNLAAAASARAAASTLRSALLIFLARALLRSPPRRRRRRRRRSRRFLRPHRPRSRPRARRTAPIPPRA